MQQVIYGLRDPRETLPFYVGTTADVYERFQQHLRCDGQNPRRDAKIQACKADNVMIVMDTLQRIEKKQAFERETYWIHHFLMLGAQLTNNILPAMQPKRLHTIDMSVSDFACTEEAVLAMRKQGMGKEKIIRAVWNASKGGGPAYQEASRK
jgi:predicted GIY-YIG superfamily endonuclease